MAFRLKSFFMFVLVATLLACVVRLCLVEDFRIASGSMIPSLLPGDLVFVSKAEYNVRIPFANYELFRFKRPKVSDVIAFTLPDRGLETFVKRVVAVEGDNVAVRGGIFYINDKPARYTATNIPAPAGSGPGATVEWEDIGIGVPHRILQDRKMVKDYGPVDVPAGNFFVLGDNRVESVDSRTWGPIPYFCLKGRVELVWLSVDPQLGVIRRERVGLRVH